MATCYLSRILRSLFNVAYTILPYPLDLFSRGGVKDAFMMLFSHRCRLHLLHTCNAPHEYRLSSTLKMTELCLSHHCHLAILYKVIHSMQDYVPEYLP